MVVEGYTLFSEGELKLFEKTIQDKRTYRRFLCVWLREKESKTAEEIAVQVGFHWRHVQRIQQQVRTGGLEALRPQYRGGGRQLLKTEQEATILKGLEQVPTARPIQEALSKALGRPFAGSTVYSLLKRHGWKAKRPRPRHPKAEQEAQELFKKTIRNA